MKIIINIPDDEYRILKETGAWNSGLIECIKNGTPLDDLKAKVKIIEWVLEVLDNIGKAESEE